MKDVLPTARTRLRRKHERGAYDRETIHAIIDAAILCHIAYNIDDQPFCTPTAHWREGEWLYWHGSSASRALRRQAQNIPVCVAIIHLDGLVLARSGFHCSIDYRSVMLFGKAEKVEGEQRKARALEMFIERLFPGRVGEMRAMRPQETKATSVLRMKIGEASAKIRTGPPKDDEEDYAAPIWAGNLPIRQVVQEPVPCPRLAPGQALSASLANWQPGRALDALLRAQASAGNGRDGDCRRGDHPCPPDP